MLTQFGSALRTMTIITVVIVAAAAVASQADARCVEQEMAGAWVNTDPHARWLGKVEIDFPCYDAGEAGPAARVHAYGVCYPNACDWGRADAHDAAWSAADRQYTRLEVRYNRGHAVKHLTLLRLARIRLLVFSDVRFTGSGGRSGFTRIEYFRPMRSSIVWREENG
jgi:hypothetical protein